MTPDDIGRLVARLKETGIVEFELRSGETRLLLRFEQAPAVLPPPTVMKTGEDACLRATGIGRFRLNHPARPAHPEFPRRVTGGTVVAFLQSGPLLRAVTAERDCTLGPPLVGDGAVIGYGTALFALL